MFMTKEHGLAQERKIIDAIRRKPMTQPKIAEILGITTGGAYFHVQRMRGQKRIRVCGWEVRKKTRPLPIFGIGGAPDAEYVPVRTRKPPQKDRVEKFKVQVLLALQDPMTTKQLSEKLYLSASAMGQYIRELRAEKKVRIHGWIRAGSRNGWAPVYRIGSYKDKPRPPVETEKERRMRERSNPEYRERENEMRRIRDRNRRARERGRKQGPFAALGL